MIGYPFDSKVEYDTEGKPIYDRAITSEPLRRLYDKLFSTGVMPNPSDNFQVMAGDAGMTVKVNPGFAVVKGCLKLEETIRTIEIQAASSSLDRIDTVVLRLNDEVNARICDLYVRQGIPASSPTRPDLVRSGSVYEIGLADIFIPANTATIVQKRITDTRLDPDRCGYVSSISKFDTETLYLQIQNDLADFKLNEQAEFLEWFEYIKVQLSEDVAGNLQNQIGVLLNLKTEIKTDLVNAINWLKENIDTLNSNFSDIGSHASARISVAENITIGTSSTIIIMGTPISNTNTNIFTEADGGGILIKKRGIYLVRCRLHIMQSVNDIIRVAIQRYLTNETDGVYPIQSYTPNPDYAVQLTVDFLSVIYHDSDITDRFVVGVWGDNGNSFVYGTNIASDSMISVTKIG